MSKSNVVVNPTAAPLSMIQILSAMKRVEMPEFFDENTDSYPGTRYVREGETYAEINDCNILGVSAKTNCPKGGDRSHGGYTSLTITDVTSTDLKVRIGDEVFEVDEIEIILGGDAEFLTFLEALEFAAVSLRQQYRKNGGGSPLTTVTADRRVKR